MPQDRGRRSANPNRARICCNRNRCLQRSGGSLHTAHHRFIAHIEEQRQRRDGPSCARKVRLFPKSETRGRIRRCPWKIGGGADKKIRYSCPPEVVAKIPVDAITGEFAPVVLQTSQVPTGGPFHVAVVAAIQGRYTITVLNAVDRNLRTRAE